MNLKDLEGKKTYIVAGLVAAATVAKYLGYIDEDLYQTIMGLLGAGGIATLAAKSNRIDKKLIIFIFLSLSLGSVTYARQTSMVCGQGVLLKNEGSIIIDGWKLFPNLNYPNPPTPLPGPPTPNDWKDGPARVTFGLTVSDNTPICWETSAGSKCTTMKAIREMSVTK